AGIALFVWGIAGLGRRFELFALRRPTSWKRAAAIAVGIWIGMAILASVLGPLLHPGREQGLTPTRWEPAHAAAYVANSLLIAVLVPVVEEVTFRGLGFSLLRRYGEWTAILSTGLIFGPAATAAPPDLTVEVSRTDGGAPLKVTFTAVGEAASYRWDFGDGSTADGRSVEHTYQAGRWTASLTARSADGDAATKTVSVTARGLTLTGPERVRYARWAVLRGALIPADASVPLTVAGPPGVNLQTRTKQDGTFAVRLRVFRPGLYTATLADVASSAPVRLDVVPQLRTGLVGSGARGARLVFAASVRPKDAGDLDVTITRNGGVVADNTFRSPVRIKLDTRRLATYRIRVSVQPNEGFTNAVHIMRASVVLPRLAYGAR